MNYNEIINSTPVVLVEFYASWCPHCKKMAPIVDRVAAKVGDEVNISRIDIDEEEQLSDSQNIEVVPTFIVYRNGKEYWRKSGEMTADDLLAVLAEA